MCSLTCPRGAHKSQPGQFSQQGPWARPLPLLGWASGSPWVYWSPLLAPPALAPQLRVCALPRLPEATRSSAGRAGVRPAVEAGPFSGIQTLHASLTGWLLGAFPELDLKDVKILQWAWRRCGGGRRQGRGIPSQHPSRQGENRGQLSDC